MFMRIIVCVSVYLVLLFFFKQKTAYELRISDWSSDVCSSDLPALRDLPKPASGPALALAFITGDAGLCEIGHDGAGFAFDCETPRHSVFLAPHALANRLVTNGDRKSTRLNSSH